MIEEDEGTKRKERWHPDDFLKRGGEGSFQKKNGREKGGV